MFPMNIWDVVLYNPITSLVNFIKCVTIINERSFLVKYGTSRGRNDCANTLLSIKPEGSNI